MVDMLVHFFVLYCLDGSINTGLTTAAPKCCMNIVPLCLKKLDYVCAINNDFVSEMITLFMICVI